MLSPFSMLASIRLAPEWIVASTSSSSNAQTSFQNEQHNERY